MSPITIEGYSDLVPAIWIIGASVAFIAVAALAFNFLHSNSSATNGETGRQSIKQYVFPLAFTVLLLAGIASVFAGLNTHETAKQNASDAFFNEIEKATGVDILGEDLYDYSDLISTEEHSLKVAYSYENTVFEGIILIQENQGQLMIPVNSEEDQYIPFDKSLIEKASV